jgi:hypothetical protein
MRNPIKSEMQQGETRENKVYRTAIIKNGATQKEIHQQESQIFVWILSLIFTLNRLLSS